ncbi:MAG TPA: transposase [Thermoanaerobaculia bacterium]|nr:transposase [Thermoanaerobaculia bacterium]
MSRPIRFIPPGGAVVEITCRTLHGRYLLKPSRELNEIVVGIVARAARRSEVEVHAIAVLSNHMHLLVSVRDARRLAGFMEYVNGNLAREAGRLHRWRHRFWARRYRAIVVSDEEAAQVGRLRYLLAQGTKEGLVATPTDWPGVHCAKALLRGDSLRGIWIDRTRECAARKAGKKYHRYTYADDESLSLAPLPCWRHLSAESHRRAVAGLIAEITTAARSNGPTAISSKARVRAVLRVHPHDSPGEPDARPAPAFHAYRRRARRRLEEAYREFTRAYRAASERLRTGDRSARFPAGSFPPALPFVTRPAGRDP